MSYNCKVYKLVACLVSAFLLLMMLPSPECLAQNATFDSLVEELRRASSEQARIVILEKLSGEVMYSSPTEALNYTDSLILLATKLSDLTRKANGLRNKSAIYWIYGRYEEAHNYAIEALTISEELGDTRLIMRALDLVASLNNAIGDLNKSVEYREKALAMALQLKDTATLIQIHINSADVYRKMRRFDEALSFAKKGQQLSQVVNDISSEGLCMINISEIYEAQNMDVQARIFAEKAYQLLYDSRNYFDAAYALKLQGRIYRKLGQYNVSMQKLQDSRELATKVNAMDDLVGVYYEMAETSKANQQYVDALKYLELHIQLKDSVQQQKHNQQIRLNQNMYDASKTRSELEALAKEREQQWYIIGLLVFSIFLFCAFAIAQYKNHRKTKDTNKLLAHQNEVVTFQKEAISKQQESITQQNLELEAKNQELQELNNEKNYLIRIVAHDLRNPLHHIKGMVSLLRMSISEPNNEQTKYLGMINEAIDRLNTMISKILDIDAIESKHIKLSAEPVAIDEVLHQVLWNFRHSAFAKNIDIVAELNPNSVAANIDKHHITQVFENLVPNAIKFSPHGRKIFARTQIRNQKIRIEIEDQGPGINPSEMNKLFGKYQRLSAKPTAGEQSFGIGLSIVKKYVEAMNGKVWCESKDGKGACFIVEFDKA